MPDYQDGKIYAIRCLTSGKQYIGSTTNKTLARRLAQHKSAHTRFTKGLKQSKMTSFEIIEENNYRIELIEHYPCESKDELFSREGYFIRELECVNKVVAGRTAKEWTTQYRQANKEKITERVEKYNQKYYSNNKEKEKERHAKYN